MYTNLQVFVGPDREIRGRVRSQDRTAGLLTHETRENTQNIFKAGPQPPRTGRTGDQGSQAMR